MKNKVSPELKALMAKRLKPEELAQFDIEVKESSTNEGRIVGNATTHALQSNDKEVQKDMETIKKIVKDKAVYRIEEGNALIEKYQDVFSFRKTLKSDELDEEGNETTEEVEVLPRLETKISSKKLS